MNFVFPSGEVKESQTCASLLQNIVLRCQTSKYFVAFSSVFRCTRASSNLRYFRHDVTSKAEINAPTSSQVIQEESVLFDTVVPVGCFSSFPFTIFSLTWVVPSTKTCALFVRLLPWWTKTLRWVLSTGQLLLSLTHLEWKQKHGSAVL